MTADDSASRTVTDGVRRAVERWLSDPGDASDPVEPGARYLAALSSGGYGTPTWPVEFGGRASSNAELAAILRVREELPHPDLYAFLIGLAIVGPTVLRHGTREQQARWLPSISNGGEVWCQMFSEPEAGSDLANVHTLAERDGDAWRISGQKVWTSRAAYADHALCLVRTDPHQPKHRGLTMVALDMRRSGITVRPLVQMNRDTHFSEVFIDDYQAPASDVVSQVGDGWSVAMTVLGHERGIANDRLGGLGAMSAPAWWREIDASVTDPVRRDQAMRAVCLDLVTRLTALRATITSSQGRAGPEGSGAKLRAVAAYRAMADVLAGVAGASAMLDDTPLAWTILTTPAQSIRGGTDEIQRNILGERVLGLPGDVRVDRDVPWTDSSRGVGR